MNALRPYRLTRVLLTWLACCAVLLITSNADSHAPQQSAEPQTSAAVAPPPAGSVTLVVSVTNSDGAYVSGLLKDNFTIMENKTAREISFFSAQDEPAGIGVVFDVSNSMVSWDRGQINALKMAALRLITRCHPASQVFVADFSNRFRLITDWTNKGQDVLAAVKNIGAHDEQQQKLKRNETALFDACAAALDKAVHAPQRKQVLLLFTDGLDSYSKLTFNELRQRLRASGILLYTITPTIGQKTSELDIGGQAVVDELSAVTGGRAFFPQTEKELADVVDHIGIELRHQYLIGFVPGNIKERGKWTPLKIKVALPPPNKQSLIAHSRNGYFVPLATP